MDSIDTILNAIITKVTGSSLSDEEKADIFAELAVGMRKLVWPILLSHVPGYALEYAMKKDQLSMEEYADIITSSLANPGTAKELHDELLSALTEVDDLLKKRLG